MINKIAAHRVVLLVGVLSSFSAVAQWHSQRTEAMTTTIEWAYWIDKTQGLNPQAIDSELSLVFKRVDEAMNRYAESSELSLVNRSAAKGPVEISPSLFRVLEASLRISGVSKGAFDMTFGSVGYLYNFREKRQPSQAAIDPTINLVDYRLVQLDKSQQTVFFLKEGVRLDLGGVAKGYAVDMAVEVLRRHGIAHARVSAGGDMRLLGSKRGEDWVVGIKDPRQPEELAVRLPLSNISISTSGDYERYFINEKGERVHHILSPQTGKSARALQSATVIGELSIDTDALSTAVFVLGVERGLALINGLDGFDAILIDQKRNMHYSVGLMPPEPTE